MTHSNPITSREETQTSYIIQCNSSLCRVSLTEMTLLLQKAFVKNNIRIQIKQYRNKFLSNA